MYLLNTKTRTLSEFSDERDDDRRPAFAISSHRWGESEILFHEMQSGVFDRSSSGYRKIKAFCSLALSYAYDWVWVDTCCIDKKSSAEPSKAIDSMYRYYEMAQGCCVYMNDMTWDDPNEGKRRSKFRHSAWFPRVEVHSGPPVHSHLIPPVLLEGS